MFTQEQPGRHMEVVVTLEEFALRVRFAVPGDRSADESGCKAGDLRGVPVPAVELACERLLVVIQDLHACGLAGVARILAPIRQLDPNLRTDQLLQVPSVMILSLRSPM